LERKKKRGGKEVLWKERKERSDENLVIGEGQTDHHQINPERKSPKRKRRSPSF